MCWYHLLRPHCLVCPYIFVHASVLRLLLVRAPRHSHPQVVKNEGVKSLFKGAGANILRAVAGAGVLSGYDQLQVIMFGEYSPSSG